MDLDSLKSQVSNLSLYDIKAGFRKAQNAVMNYTEMEAKVREATNNEPWGASSSLMQEIANGTFNYATLNEIMPMIYKRFTEKTAEEWRQIYKSLQLLEFLIKNGSERVIDDARSHISLLKMLRQFHYIDSNGKDQGINVRNRAKELGDMLSDVEKIRAERKKARATRNKYSGQAGGMSLGSDMGGGGRYGGYGNDSSYGGYSGGVYGDGGGFGGRSNEWDDTTTQSRRDRFEEYDEYDEGAVASPTSASARATSAPKRTAAKAEPKPKEPEVDLLGFGDEPEPQPSSSGYSAAPTSFTQPATAADDDDFDDFQSAATPAATKVSGPPQFPMPQVAAPQMQSAPSIPAISPPASAGPNYSAFSIAAPQAPQVPAQQATQKQPQSQVPRPTGYQAAMPNYFGSIQTSSTATTPGTPATGAPTNPSNVSKPASKTASGIDPFAALGAGSKKAGATPKGQSMADMAREKTSAGIWGPPAAQPPQSQQQGNSNGFGDLI